MSLSKPTIRILLEDLDRRIKGTKQTLAEYQQAKSELEAQLGDSESQTKPIRHRLPRGMPRKLVEQALRKHGRVTMGELLRSIFEDSEYKLKDASARRSLDQMIAEGLVRQNNEGAMNLLKAGF